MKVKILLLLSLGLFVFLLFGSLNSGTAYGGIGDTTGSPLSTMTCSGGGCHGGANYGASVSISVLDDSGNVVNSYIPGQSYIVQLSISSTSGSPAGYGAQAVVLDSLNNQAGTLDTVLTPNSRISNFDNRFYLEQYGLNSGTLRARWTAPPAGRGRLTIYSAGAAVDGWGNMTDDEASAAVSISLTEAPTSSVLQLQNEQLSVFPNPANDGIFNIQIDGESGIYALEITDIIGKTVLKKEIQIESGISCPIELPQQCLSGFYFVSLSSKNKRLSGILRK
jgi:hypothetical protein